MSTMAMRRMLDRIQNHNWLRLGLVAVLILGAVVVSAVLEGDLPEFVSAGTRGLRLFFRHHSYLPGFGLLYVEESGIPLPAPGDVFVLYVGAHLPKNLFAYLAAWLGLILAVVLGATNLFFISRRYGRRLAEGRFAAYVHLSPERLEQAEKWFKRYGVLAIIFGRHIPGFRVPITVAAGVLRVPYRLFAPSVAVSTAIWAGVVIIIGINFGNRLGEFLRLHSWMYLIWAGIVVALVAIVFLSQRAQRARGRPVSDPVAR
ncbi:MAG: DedA family protein [Candidatus Dormibacteraceae bacterium]